MTELDLASLKSEEGAVSSLLIWSFAINSNLLSCTRSNFGLGGEDLGRDVVTRSLEKLSSNRPGCLTIVAHPEGFAEVLSTLDLVLIGEALLHKASRVSDVLCILGFLLLHLGLHLCLQNVGHLVWNLLSLLIGVTVLANKLGWSLITISDLQKRIVTGFATPLTLLAEIGIMAN